jgi:hypothetical protein
MELGCIINTGSTEMLVHANNLLIFKNPAAYRVYLLKHHYLPKQHYPVDPSNGGTVCVFWGQKTILNITTWMDLRLEKF